MPRLVIATRGSKLALAQAQEVARALRGAEAGLSVELVVVKTTGDKILDVPLAKVGGKGLFVKEIEDALLAGRADVAVHSMKDMPAELPQGLCLAAVSRRQDVRDVLAGPGVDGLAGLPWGARVGTSSLRRQAQLLHRRPDLEIVPIRGNVQTRLRKLEEENLAAVVLAQAGLVRLGLDEVPRVVLEAEEFLPAVGQGALGIETRRDDQATRRRVAALDHMPTARAVAAERAFLARLEGGCQVPIAGHARYRDGRVELSALVASLDGARLVRGQGQAPADEAEDLGRRVAEQVLADGGREILEEVYGEAPA